MADYNSKYTGSQIDNAVAKCNDIPSSNNIINSVNKTNAIPTAEEITSAVEFVEGLTVTNTQINDVVGSGGSIEGYPSADRVAASVAKTEAIPTATRIADTVEYVEGLTVTNTQINDVVGSGGGSTTLYSHNIFMIAENSTGIEMTLFLMLYTTTADELTLSSIYNFFESQCPYTVCKIVDYASETNESYYGVAVISYDRIDVYKFDGTLVGDLSSPDTFVDYVNVV